MEPAVVCEFRTEDTGSLVDVSRHRRPAASWMCQGIGDRPPRDVSGHRRPLLRRLSGGHGPFTRLVADLPEKSGEVRGVTLGATTR